MNLETQIQSLLAKAAPLRAVPDDDPIKVPLTAIVDEINRLRALQAIPGNTAIAVKQRKAAVEGADA